MWDGRKRHEGTGTQGALRRIQPGYPGEPGAELIFADRGGTEAEWLAAEFPHRLVLCVSQSAFHQAHRMLFADLGKLTDHVVNGL